MNLFRKISDGFVKTREALAGKIRSAVHGKKIDDEVLEELEEILITADLGVDISLLLIERIREQSKDEKLEGDDVLNFISEELKKMITDVPEKSSEETPSDQPRVIFVVGVNGSGKTTTIGKLANYYAEKGKKVLIIAADTFRSAAVEQVVIWAERAGVDIVRGATGADPGSVVYDGLQAAVARNIDIVLVDTAGRLHTKVNLMKELEKLDRVAKKIIPSAPHEVLLVIDGTTGQNGLSQARHFTETSGVNSLAVTKLDGTAKGGVIVPIGKELGIPVRWIGLGEGLHDLVPFDPEMVVKAIIQPYMNSTDNPV
ncbi:MAG: signal recognition particle-docking protein FtsY [Candidatus Electryonea clarkiae]|nr:signal recognition particle-docking protein FtsY [Candidatus Electryonea clarkiae]MDP8286704.1 signal recognition particle-docking protein FtsY [Candidatus Electryonea clarkiae]